MFSPKSSDEKELLKAVLEPLLEDFKYWFDRSQQLLETQRVSILSVDEQAELLARLETAQKELVSAKLLFQATGEQVGVDPVTMVPWHQLVTDCWNIARRWRLAQQDGEQLDVQSTGS